MINSYSEFLDYIKYNPQISKRDFHFSHNFVRSFDYVVNYLRNYILQETGEPPLFIGGSYFADKFFIFDDEETYLANKKDFEAVLSKCDVNAGDIYVTVINKTKTEFENAYYCLKGEILSIEPESIYLISVKDVSLVCAVLSENPEYINKIKVISDVRLLENTLDTKEKS